AADVVKQLRILAGGLRGHIETIDCTEFLKEASARLRRRFLLNLVGVRVECRDRALTIEAAPDLLHIVLYNLLINGVEAALRANIEKPRLILRAKQPSTNSIVIEVIDNGPGIDVNLKDRIFEPFVSGTAGGSGLGLAICRDVMEWHGGGITFEDSVPRIGAKISLTLPLKERGGA
ncbi:MAG: ATP-binding protein, partial [Sphingomonadales bacterium]|nr:ATP-binding protein [Sphingomonadales bacterium]